MSLSLDKNDIEKKISDVSSLKELEILRVQYLGKKGLLTSEMKSLSLLSVEEKKEKGQKLNIFKTLLENELSNKKIRVNSICPGDVEGNMMKYAIKKIEPDQFSEENLTLLYTANHSRKDNSKNDFCSNKLSISRR